jgi:hypothetical protein
MSPSVYRALYRFFILDSRKKLERGDPVDKVVDDLLDSLRRLPPMDPKEIPFVRDLRFPRKNTKPPV